MEEKQCKICGGKFIPSHFNQKICSEKCKWQAKRIVQEKYKKSKKGKISYLRWLRNPKRKEIAYQYYLKNKEKFKQAARKWAKKYYWQHKNEKEFQEKRKKIWLKWKEKNYEKIRQRNRIATAKYRKTEKGKQAQKRYKYLRRNPNAGKIDFKKWKEKIKELNYRCQRCGKKMKINEITIDHIVPLSKGGTNLIENLQPLCRSCNCKKNNKL
ncbi:MAG: hypothetical protein KatS3mg096_783 [Candidatus Parcubacteria bacterium]|nr:MAG: hypothetical protein KatS3mg096_783 [Candidatus Parcubacteria bacterium]